MSVGRPSCRWLVGVSSLFDHSYTAGVTGLFVPKSPLFSPFGVLESPPPTTQARAVRGSPATATPPPDRYGEIGAVQLPDVLTNAYERYDLRGCELVSEPAGCDVRRSERPSARPWSPAVRKVPVSSFRLRLLRDTAPYRRVRATAAAAMSLEERRARLQTPGHRQRHVCRAQSGRTPCEKSTSWAPRWQGLPCRTRPLPTSGLPRLPPHCPATSCDRQARSR